MKIKNRVIAFIFILPFFLTASVLALPADINESNRVDGFDLILFSRVKGTTPASPNWLPEADINNDEIIDEKDLEFFTVHFARKGVVSSLWVSDYNNNKIVKLSGKTGKELLRTGGFLNPYSIAVNPLDGSCWISDYGNNSVVKLDSNGSEVLRINGFNKPQCIAYNWRDGSCWVGEYDKIVKLSSNGEILFRAGGFLNPGSLDLDLLDGSCWIADYDHNQVVKLNANGVELTRKDGFNKPVSVSVNQRDGSCWIADKYNNQVVRLISTGTTELIRIGGFNRPNFISINWLDESIWIADYENNQVARLDKNGAGIVRVTGFIHPFSVAADPFDYGCWVADYESNQVVKLSPNGKEMMRLSGFNRPKWIALVPEEIKPDAPYVNISTNRDRIDTGEEIIFNVSGSDTNGFIQKYELDFEGDGVYDTSLDTAGIIFHIYESSGIYNAVVKAVDDSRLQIYDSKIIRAGRLAARGSVNPAGGNAPLTVNFSVEFFDPADGRVENYQWDFDGDGIFDYLSPISGTTSYIYQNAGTYQAIVKVTDTDGSTAIDSVTVTVNGSLPKAKANANPGQGPIPLTVNLSSSGTSDPDGFIALYQWDFNRDGIFDWNSVSGQDASYTYPVKGIYNPGLKVTDNSGLSDSAYCTVIVNQSPPGIQAGASPAGGNAPLGVSFNGTGTDIDGYIVNYKWDFGDGIEWNSDSTGISSHIYNSAGIYNAVFKVTDNEGGSSTTSVFINVFPPGNPFASVSVFPDFGTVPLEISFTGTGTDPGGQIAKYEWDFGDGNKLDSSGYATTQLFLGVWPGTGCGDTISHQSGIESFEPSEGEIFNSTAWFSKGDPDGNFDWNSVFGPLTNIYAYSHIYVYSPSAQTARIKFGADDACRFWVNGLLVNTKSACEPLSLNKYSFDINLNAGWNRILACVSQGVSGWGLAYRITDTNNIPLRLYYSLNKSVVGLPYFYWSSDSTGVVSHTYNLLGNYNALFKVTDNSGLYSTASILIKAQSKPIPDLKTNVIQGNVPLELSFVGSGNDPDGYIVKYELDYEGDEIYDFISTTNIGISHIYQISGVYHPVLKVTDNDGYFNTASLTILVDKSFPFVQLSADPRKGNAPLPVSFKTDFSDRDGFISLFEWDFDDDDLYESSTAFDSLVYIYDSAGNYEVKVRVTDNDGLKAVSSANIQVNPDGSPLAEIFASPATGNNPLDVYFRGTGIDPGGWITGYEFDFNGDGVYDTLFDSLQSYESVKCTYESPGVYEAKLKVTDNDGLTDAASAKIFVSSASLWVADCNNNQVVKLDAAGKALKRIDGFYKPYTVSANKVDGSCWAADTYNNRIVKISAGGQKLFSVNGFNRPSWVSVNSNDGSCWVADEGNDQIVKLGEDGLELLKIGGFYRPHSVSVNTGDGSCWVADRYNNRIVKLSSGGVKLKEVNGFNRPMDVSVNSNDGSCWVSNTNSGQIVKLDSNGQELLKIAGFSVSYGRLAVNPVNGNCWIADRDNNRIVRLDNTGKLICVSGGFTKPEGVYPDIDGGCWAGNTYAGKIVKLSANGTRLFEKTGFNLPTSVSIDPGATGLNLPEAIAVITPLAGDSPMAVSFSATAVDTTAPIINYEWDFEGDGAFDLSSATEAGANVLYTYSSAGVYNPVLRVTNSNNLYGYDYKNIVRIGPAVINISQNKISGNAPLMVAFTVSAFSPGGFITKYEWDFNGDGTYDWNSLTTGNTNYTYSLTGIYQPVLKITDQSGTEFIKSASQIVINKSNPVTVLNASPASGIRPLSVLFNMADSYDPDGSIILYELDYNNDGVYDWNSKTPVEAGYIYNSAGIYFPALKVTDNDGLFSTARVSVTVNPVPLTVTAQASPARGKTPLNVSFTGTANSEYPVVLYEWNFEEGYKLNENGYATTQLFTGKWPASGWNDTACGQIGIENVEPSEGETYNTTVWFKRSDSDGNFDWNSVFGPGLNTYAYSHIYVYSPQEQVVRIKFGKDDSCRFWINGELKYSVFTNEGVNIDEYSFDFTLRQGWNRVLAFVLNGPGWWGLSYRITDTNNNPLQLKYVLNNPYGAIPPEINYCNSTVSADTSYNYGLPGTWQANLKVTDYGGRYATASVNISVLPPGNPEAGASALPVTGDTPLKVDFTGSGTDTDGIIVKYEWDFEGNGTYDWNSNTTGVTSYTYNSAGTYNAVLRVTDDSNLTDTAKVSISAGLAPSAFIQIYPVSGNVPLDITFTPRGIDSDGSVYKYEIDFDGDGTYDYVNSIPDKTTYTYKIPGIYKAKLKVTDNDNLTGFAEIAIEVKVPSVPQVSASANPVQGIVPLNVYFSGLASDLDGIIKRFEWDFQGDGLYDLTSDSSAAASYVYESVGIYKAVLKITDNDNNYNTSSVIINVTSSLPPEITASANPASGTAPLKVSFTASVVETTSQIIKYEWDFNGDGIYDFFSDTTGNTEYTYTLANDYTAALRVTDSKNVSAMKTIPIKTGMGITATISRESFDPALAETISINSVLTQPAKVTFRIVDRNQNPVRTIISNIDREAGFYGDLWNGRDDSGNIVKVGLYSFVIDYEINGKKYTYDLTNTSGNHEVASFTYPVSFSPYDGRLCTMQYTLDKASEINVCIWWAPYSGSNYIVKTINMREPQKSGDYVTVWDGTNDEGTICPEGVYVMLISKWALAQNAIIVAGKPIISDFSLPTGYFSPDPGLRSNIRMNFRLSKPGKLKVLVRDSLGNYVNETEILNVGNGLHSIGWNGINKNGYLVKSGKYSLGVQAIDAAGNASNWMYGVFKVFY